MFPYQRKSKGNYELHQNNSIKEETKIHIFHTKYL